MPDFPFSDQAPRRILVVCNQRIGDVLLATPLVRSLKRAWPAAEIDFLAFKGTEGVLAGNPDIANIIALPHRTNWRGKLAQFRQLWRRYDLAAATIPSDRSRIYAWIAARYRVGFLTSEVKDASKTFLLNRSVTFDDLDTHTVAMGERLTELLGIPARFEVVPPSLNPDALPATLELLAPLGERPRVVIHAFPKFPYKMWRVEAWVELGRRLQQQGFGVVLTGGPDRDEVAYCTRIAEDMGGAVLNLAGRLSLAATAEILSRSRLYVGPDTAVTHIAAATGIPTVALFGPSNPVKWGPWPKSWRQPASPWLRTGSGRQGNVYLLQGTGDCVPCLLEGCDRHEGSLSRCLQEITVDRVFAATQQMLDGAD